MRCHACDVDHSLSAGSPLGFRETCAGCDADLHVCRNCAHHDPAAYNGCRESNAERVRDEDRANRCDYLRPDERERDESDAGAGAGSDAALEALEALFKKG